MTTLRPYPECKSAGIDRKHEKRADWKQVRLKHVARLNPSKNEIDHVQPDELVTFLPMERVSGRGVINTSVKRKLADVFSGFTYFRADDVIVAKITPCFENGKGACITNLDSEFGFGSTEFHVLRPGPELLPQFLYRVTTSFEFRAVGADFMEGSAGQKRVPSDWVANYQFDLPPLPEQHAIADFLDVADARISRYIAAKRRMIALLEEQKQAIINQAVTRGLDPDVPLKPSGVDWLGDIPAHWDRRVVGQLFSMGRGVVTSHEYIAQYPVYSSQTADDGVMGRIATYKFDGDYLTWTTDGANAGTVFLRSGKFNCTNVCGALKPRDNVHLPFARYALAAETRRYVRLDINPKLMNNVMARIQINLPPLGEQVQIARILDQRTAENNAIGRRAKREIELVQEYRTRLISDVVTGKLDVRGVELPAMDDVLAMEVPS